MVNILVLLDTDFFSDITTIIQTIEYTKCGRNGRDILIFNTFLLLFLFLHQNGANPYNRLGLILFVSIVCKQKKKTQEHNMYHTFLSLLTIVTDDGATAAAEVAVVAFLLPMRGCINITFCYCSLI